MFSDNGTFIGGGNHSWGNNSYGNHSWGNGTWRNGSCPFSGNETNRATWRQRMTKWWEHNCNGNSLIGGGDHDQWKEHRDGRGNHGDWKRRHEERTHDEGSQTEMAVGFLAY